MRLAATFPADLPASCSTNGISTSCTTRCLVQPLFRLARVCWQIGDVTIIDGVPNGLAALTTEGSREAVKIQTGSLAAYAFVMLIGVVVLVGIFMLFR